MTDYQLDLVDQVVDVSVRADAVQLDGPDDEVTLEVAGEVLEVAVVDDLVELVVDDQVVELAMAGVVWPVGGGEEPEMMLDLEVDQSVAGVTYYGQAQPGSAPDAAVWRIARVTQTVTGLSRDWAGGTADFDKVWDDRLTLSYGP